MSSRQPRRSASAGAAANGAQSRKRQPSARHGSSTNNAHVADVCPTYTIPGEVRCAETVNDRVAWTAETDGRLTVRSLPKGTELKVLAGRPRARCTALLYIEAMQHMWAGFEDGYVRVYAVLDTALVREFSVVDSAGAAVTAMLTVEGMVFIGAEDGGLTQWAADTLDRMRVLPGHLSPVRALGCHLGPTGSVVFSGGDDGTVKAWDPYLPEDGDGDGAASACLETIAAHERSAVRAIEVVNYANQLWTAGDDATVRVWNLETLECAAVLRGHAAPVTTLLSIESRMWSGDEKGHIILWDTNSCAPLQELTTRPDGGTAKHGAILTMKKMLPSTSWKVWTAGAAGAIQCWNAETVPILFTNKRQQQPKKGRAGSSPAKRQGSLDNRKGNDADDEDAEAWRLFQRAIMDQQQQNADNGVRLNVDGRQPSLGIVNIQRLAEEFGYERGRMEVQRELQTQQLLEEENAQLKQRLRAVEKQRGAAAAVAADGTPAGNSAPSAVLTREAEADPTQVLASRLRRTFPGDNWAYLLAEKPHELRTIFTDETATALGVPASQIVRVDFAKGSLIADVDVQHHASVSAEEMDARLQAHDFSRTFALHRHARSTPKVGLDAAEETLVTLEQQLQDATEEIQALKEQQNSSLNYARESPESSVPLSDLQRQLDAIQQQNDSLNHEMRLLREENEALQRIADRSRDAGGDESTGELADLLAARASENARLQEELDAERDGTAYLKSVIAEKEQQRAELERQLAERPSVKTTPNSRSLNAPLQQQGRQLGGCAHSIPSASEDRVAPSVDMSPSPPAVDNTSKKAARPYTFIDAKDDNHSTNSNNRSPLENVFAARHSSSGYSAIDDELSKTKAELAALQEEHQCLNDYLHNQLKPMISRLKRGNGEKELEIHRLNGVKDPYSVGRRQNVDGAAAALGETLFAGAPAGEANGDLQKKYDDLLVEYECLNDYLHNQLKPMISRLKRGNGEKELEIHRLNGVKDPYSVGRRQNVDGAAAALGETLFAGEGDSNLQKKYDELLEDHEALQRYVQNWLKPSVGRLKRGNAEKEIEIFRLKGIDRPYENMNYFQRMQETVAAEKEGAPSSAAPAGATAEKLRETEQKLAEVQLEYDCLRNYLHDQLKPMISRLKRGNGEKELEIHRLNGVKDPYSVGRRQNVDGAAAALGETLFAGAPAGEANGDLQKKYDDLLVEYECLNNYLHDQLKPMIARLKRGNGEKELEIHRLNGVKDPYSVGRRQNVDGAAAALGETLFAGAPEGDSDDVHKKYDELLEDHEALKKYVQNWLKPSVGRLKRGNAEKEIEIFRLKGIDRPYENMNYFQRMQETAAAEKEGAPSSAAPAGATAEKLRETEQKLAEVQLEYDCLRNYLHDQLKPMISRLKRGNGEKELEIHRLNGVKDPYSVGRRQNVDGAAAALGETLFAGAPAGEANGDLQKKYDDLLVEYECLNNYLHDQLKPMIARLKRGNGEKELEIHRLNGVKDPYSVGRRQNVDGAAAALGETLFASAPEGSATAEAEKKYDELLEDHIALQRYVQNWLKPSVGRLKRGNAEKEIEIFRLKGIDRPYENMNYFQRMQETAAAEKEGAPASAASASNGPEVQALRRELRSAQAEAAAKGAALQEVQRELDVLKRALEGEGALRGVAGAEDAYLDEEEHRLRSDKLGEAAEALRQELEEERARREALEDALGQNHVSPQQQQRAGNGQSLEAQNLALTVRLADAETVVADLQTMLERTAAQLDAQKKEAGRLMNIIADLQEEKVASGSASHVR